MYVNTWHGEHPPSPKLPAQTADSNRGAEKHFQQMKFKTFCPQCKGVFSVKRVIGIEQNETSTRYTVVLDCPAEHSKSVVQMVARSEAQKEKLKASKAKSKQFAEEYEQEIEQDPEAVALDMLEPEPPAESEAVRELDCEWGRA